MEKSDRYLVIALLVIGLALALLGQYVISYQRGAWSINGVALLAAGGGLVVLVVVALRSPGRAAGTPSVLRILAQVPSRVLVPTTVAVVLVAWGTYLIHWRASRYGILLWMMGLFLAVLALWRPAGQPRRRAGEVIVGWEVALVAAILLVALALRLAGLADFPRPMSGDEGSMALEAGKILRGRWVNPFGTGWFSHPNYYFYLLAASLRVFGWSLTALRLPSAVLGAFGVAAVYVLGRNLFGRETALVGALFLAGWPLGLHLSRLALNNSADIFFAAMVMAFLHRGLVWGDRWAFVVAGLALGLGLHFYFATRLLVAMVPIMVLLGGWRRSLRRWRGLLVLVVVAVLAFAPLGVHYLHYPDDFVARMATDGLFRSGQLDHERAATGRSRVWLFAEHLIRAATAFVFTLDRGYFYTDTAPMLQVLSGALFLVGLELAVLRIRQPRYLGMVVWLGVVVLANGALVRSPPGYHRYLVAAPVVSLLVGRAAVVIARQLAHSLALSRLVRLGALTLLAAAVAFSGGWTYFARYATSGNFADRNTEIADRAAQAMAATEGPYHTYFLGVPAMPLEGFNSVRFLAPDATWDDVPEGLPASWHEMLPHRGLLFIALPGRASALRQVREACPVGQYQVAVSRQGDVLFHTYQLPPGSSCGVLEEAP